MLVLLRLLRLIFPLLVIFFTLMTLFRLVAPFLRGGAPGAGYGDGRQGTGSDSGSGGGRSRRESSSRGSGSSGGAAGGEDPYVILGCERSATDEEIRRRYRKLMSLYHPDRFISMDLDEEFVQMASRKIQKIREAYEQIARQRGFRPR